MWVEAACRVHRRNVFSMVVPLSHPAPWNLPMPQTRSDAISVCVCVCVCVRVCVCSFLSAASFVFVSSLLSLSIRLWRKHYRSAADFLVLSSAILLITYRHHAYHARVLFLRLCTAGACYQYSADEGTLPCRAMVPSSLCSRRYQQIAWHAGPCSPPAARLPHLHKGHAAVSLAENACHHRVS